MKHETNKNDELNITSTDISFEKIISKPYISDSLKEQLLKSKILILPTENFRNLEKPAFPVKTEELLAYLKNNAENPEDIDICIEEEDYQEIALHSNLIIIGTFIVVSVALPLLINLLSTYIYEKYIKRNRDSAIKLSINVQKSSGDSIRIDYEGKTDEFIKLAKTLPEKING